MAVATIAAWLAEHTLPEEVILVAFDASAKRILEEALGYFPAQRK